MTSQSQFASLETALSNGIRLLPVDPVAAAEQAREILAKDQYNREAMRLLAKALRRLGRQTEAEQVEIEGIEAASHDSTLVKTARLIKAGDLRQAEHLIRSHLSRHGDDAAALRLLGEIGALVGQFREAERILRRALAEAPTYASARLKLANVLFRQGHFPAAIEELNNLLEFDPEHGNASASKAATLVRVGDYEEAIALYEQLIARTPESPELWTSFGHVMNTVGRFEDSIAAYRRAIELKPAQGEAWWCLANLKTVQFTDPDIAAMLSSVALDSLHDNARLQLHFALGKAFEDAGEFAKAFEHYAAGNRIRDERLKYDPLITHRLVVRTEKAFDKKAIETLSSGAEDPDPIFIVGLPRAGSTLVEQILSSHSKIEGTSELPYIPTLRQQLAAGGEDRFPASVLDLSSDELRTFGQRYLDNARANRKTGRPFFVDKLPNNWESLGFILAILPNARIIDARRHPMACCFSNFKQHFARGQAFTYSLRSIGLYYADYVRMMSHFDTILPDRVHRVIHEKLIEEPEAETRKLLKYIGVPFEEGCLRFYENARPVRTPSAQQVRQPLNREGLERWRQFEPWLGELKDALGPVLQSYPDVPETFQNTQ